jgi:hypothetical protein
MLTPEILLLAAIAVGIGLVVYQTRAFTAELVKLNTKLAPFADLGAELAPVVKDLPKLVKLRKPILKFMETATEGFAMPAKIAELTQSHLEQITTIAQGAVMAHDMFQQDQKRRAANPQAGPLPAGEPLPLGQPVPLPNPPANGGSVAVKQQQERSEEKMQTPKLGPVLGQGANGGKIERVTGRVEMDSRGSGSFPPSPPKPKDPPRDIALGAESAADGTS